MSAMQATPSRRNYLLVDKRSRRYSAPEDLRAGFARIYQNEESEDESRQSKVSVVDLSILFEDHSGSDISLEIDTSGTWDIITNTNPVDKCADCYDSHRSEEDDDTVWTAVCTKLVWKTVIIGQIMSICVATMYGALMMSVKSGMPLLINVYSFGSYLMLSVIWTTQLLFRRGPRDIWQVLRLSGLRYIILSVLHVEANNLIISSIAHDTFLGDHMIHCAAASLSLVVAFVCLDVQFQSSHIAGFVSSFTGSIVLCIALKLQPGDVDDAAWGDVLRLVSGLFISLNTLAQELIVKAIDIVEYLGMIGFFGTIVCGLQVWIAEKDVFYVTWCPYMTYTTTQTIFYCLAPIILRTVGTTGLHLALISSGFYSFIVHYFLQGIEVLSLYAYFLVLVGSYVFTIKRTSIGKHYFYPVHVTIARPDS